MTTTNNEKELRPFSEQLLESEERISELKKLLDKKDEEIKQLIDGIYATKTVKDLKSALRIAMKTLKRRAESHGHDCGANWNEKEALTKIKEVLGE